MSQQDVQLILQGLQQGREAAARQQELALRREQLKDQVDQFNQTHKLAVEAAQRAQEAQLASIRQGQTSLALQLQKNPELIEQLPGVVNKGGIAGLTTGNPDTETQQNLYQLPNVFNDPETGQPTFMQAPTRNALANQKATEARIALQPQIQAENARLAQEHINRLAEIAQTGLQQSDLQKYIQAQENARTEMQRRSAERIAFNSQAHEDARNAATIAANRYRTDLEYGNAGGNGLGADDYGNALTDLFTGRTTINDPTFKNLTKGQKQRLSTDLMKMGGISLSAPQMKALQQVDALKGIVDQVDEFNNINSSGLIPHIPTLDRIQGQLQGKLGTIAQTLQNEPGRKAGWMIKGSEGTVMPNKFDPFNQNIPRRDAMVKDILDYYNSQLNNLSPKQQAAIRHRYGIDQKFQLSNGIPQNATVPKTADDYLRGIGVQ